MILPATLLLLSFSLQGEALAPLDEDQPIDLSADRCEVFEAEDRVECTGQVRVTQGDALLTAEVMTIYGATRAEGFDRIEGQGSVRYARGPNAISGDEAIFDGSANTVVVTGDVVAVQGEQVMTGGRLVYNTVTRGLVVSPAEGGRVRGLFRTAGGAN